MILRAVVPGSDAKTDIRPPAALLDIAVPVVAASILADDAKPDAPVPTASAPAVTTDAPRQEFLRPVRHWEPRQSILAPFVLTILVIALARQFPGQGGSLGARLAVSDRAPAISREVATGLPPDAAVVGAESLVPLSSAPAGEVTIAFAKPPEASPDIVGADVAVGDADFVPRARACSVDETAAGVLRPMGALMSKEAFGPALAAAAEAQTRNLVVYNDEYRSLRYPGGDVSPLFGVCSDVIIRAYRALGIDLQRAVHESRAGAGDTSIDHRRTETLRRFFAKRSVGLPVTSFAEDYAPGDIVTYERPQNRRGQAHIAIVANQIGPSGRPMIIHNRGWGPQIEDALFVDEVTGHYRLWGEPETKITDRNQPRLFGPGTTWRSIRFRRSAVSKGKGRETSSKAAPRS